MVALSSSFSLHRVATTSPHRPPRLSTPGCQVPAISTHGWSKRAPMFHHSSSLQVSIFGYRKAAETHPRKREFATYASNINPPDGGSAKGKADGKSTSTADSPPLLTILAGAIVFLLFCLVVGSIVMWLVGLIIHPKEVF